MTEENQTYTTNQDGSISVKDTDGKTVKYVKDADLGAVKVRLKDTEGEVTKLQTDLAGANTKYDTEHQLVLQERAAKEQLDKNVKEGATLKTEVEGLRTQVADLTKVGGETATKLTERLRTHLETGYKIDKAKLEGKTLAEMESIESTLSLTGAVPAAANYDGKGGNQGGAGGLAGKSPLSLLTLGYQEPKNK